MFLAEIDLKKRTSLLEYNFENNYCGDDKIATEAGNHICDIIHIQQFFSESLLLNINILSILEATPPGRRTGRRTISCLAVSGMSSCINFLSQRLLNCPLLYKFDQLHFNGETFITCTQSPKHLGFWSSFMALN